jgi:hypothetical protein
MAGMSIDPSAMRLWLDALLKKALVLNYDPTCIEESSATQIELSPTGDLHLFWGKGNFDYLFAMAETTPIHDKGAFDEMQAIHRHARSIEHREVTGKVVAHFIRYMLAEDSILCRVPDHASYAGQIELGRKLNATALVGESAS